VGKIEEPGNVAIARYEPCLFDGRIIQSEEIERTHKYALELGRTASDSVGVAARRSGRDGS
jgi:hypothetical protein